MVLLRLSNDWGGIMKIQHFKTITYILFIVSIFCFFQTFVYKIALVPSSSMSPTIHKDSIVVINLQNEAYKRGNIVVFRHEGEAVVKRIVAIKGDLVESRNGYIFVNGKRVDNFVVNYVLFPFVVTGDFFVLGDNRNNSYDSHSFGAISRKQIIGKII